MTFEPLSVALDESGIKGFIKRYHFKTSEKKDKPTFKAKLNEHNQQG